MLINKKQQINDFLLNFGPQHPAAHGVLRLVLQLQGEQVKNADPHIGLLHRATEKLIEQKNIAQALPYFDRLDYVSMLSQEHAFCTTIEQVLNIGIPKRASTIRVLFLEITRILNHIMAITTHALDVGALTPFLWAFEEREKLMEFYERISGARMHANYFRPGGISLDIPIGILNDIREFSAQFASRIDEVAELLTGNRIWKQRLVQVAAINYQQAKELGATGVLLRSTGIPWDLRKQITSEIYPEIPMKVAVGDLGDCYDRYLIRMYEMRQSIQIMYYCSNIIPQGLIKIDDNKISPPSRSAMKTSMESLIHHFKLYSTGIVVNQAYSYGVTEAPKGETGVWVASNSSNKLYRCKVRAPGFAHLQGLNYLSVGHQIADLVTVIGTLDVVFGEIDR